MIFALREEASANSLNKNAGLRLAKRFNSFLKANNACSGLLSQAKLSYCGAPTAPNRMAADCLAAFKASLVRGTPC